jgi:cytosine/adenosine deaminase-related metal-dependent hydrolase
LVSGAYGDLIIVDYHPPTLMDAANLNSHILFGMSGRAVDTAIINGRVIITEGKLMGIDEQEIIANARKVADKVWQRL